MVPQTAMPFINATAGRARAAAPPPSARPARDRARICRAPQAAGGGGGPPRPHAQPMLAAALLLLAVASPTMVPGAHAFVATGARNAALTVQCTRGYDTVHAACGQAGAGHYVPDQCTAWCQLVYPSWWLKCQRVPEYATIEVTSARALSGFYSACQAAAKPTCSPCPGSAQANEVLPQDLSCAAVLVLHDIVSTWGLAQIFRKPRDQWNGKCIDLENSSIIGSRCAFVVSQSTASFAAKTWGACAAQGL